MAKITKEDIIKIADLAKIELTEDEIIKFTKDMDDIIDFVDQLSEVDVSDVKYASHIEDMQGQRTREDEPGEALPKEKVFLNAGERQKGNSFKTSKII